MKKCVEIVALVLLGTGSLSAFASNAHRTCEARYEAIQAKLTSMSPLERAKSIEMTAAACVGTGMFDVWLASDYLEAGDLAQAARIAESALKKTQSARPNLLHVLVRVDLRRGRVAEAVRKGEALATAFPDYSPIQGELAGTATQQQDWARALVHARKAYEIEGSAVTLLSMATALHQLNRHEETVAAVRRALELEPHRISKVTGVLEAIFSLAILNRRAEAAELARRHIAANPGWRANDMFSRAAEELGVIPHRNN